MPVDATVANYYNRFEQQSTVGIRQKRQIKSDGKESLQAASYVNKIQFDFH